MSKFDKEAWEKIGTAANVMTTEAGPALWDVMKSYYNSGWKAGYMTGAGVVFGSFILAIEINNAKHRRRLKKLARENKF